MSNTAGGALTATEQLRQLNDARKLVLNDVSFYPNIVQGILPIIGPAALPELRRWGAEFLSEAFATPALPSRDKESLSLLVLETIKGMVDNAKEDLFVQRSAVMTASSIYPLVLRWVINNEYDAPTWERLTAIKASILRIWDEAAPTTKLCCVKFAQRVVLAQTNAIDAEQQPKRDAMDVSLSSIPAGHPLLEPWQLEAEATGLLDRMLAVLQENSGDALMVDATLNTLSVLVRTRPSTANRILNSILNFNPLKLANAPMTQKSRVLIQSMEKTTRLLLLHLVKRDPQSPLAPRIQQYVDRLVRSRTEIFDPSSRKRTAAEQQVGSSINSKRQKVEMGMSAAQAPFAPPLGPGPHSLAKVYTLTSDAGLSSFDATVLPMALVTRVSVTLLAKLDSSTLARAVEEVKGRLALLAASAQPADLDPETAPLGVEEEDDDYEPDYFAAEDTEQILNKLDSDAPADDGIRRETTTSLTLGSFVLPSPPSLDARAAAAAGQAVVSHVFNPLQEMHLSGPRKARLGLNRVVVNSHDRESWLTVIIRLATRSCTGLGVQDEENSVKAEMEVAPPGPGRTAMSDVIRELLYVYVLDNFRSRIDVGVAWLCEEWYSDQLVQRQGLKHDALHYEKWAVRLVDGFLPYLTPQDKMLTRFLGEIPELSAVILGRIQSLCRDPGMVNLALTSLLYLVMMRPPVRDLALDAVANIWREFEDARPMAAKYLTKWRPGFVESQSDGAPGGSSSAGLPTSAIIAAST